MDAAKNECQVCLVPNRGVTVAKKGMLLPPSLREGRRDKVGPSHVAATDASGNKDTTTHEAGGGIKTICVHKGCDTAALQGREPCTKHEGASVASTTGGWNMAAVQVMVMASAANMKGANPLP